MSGDMSCVSNSSLGDQSPPVSATRLIKHLQIPGNDDQRSRAQARAQRCPPTYHNQDIQHLNSRHDRMHGRSCEMKKMLRLQALLAFLVTVVNFALLVWSVNTHEIDSTRGIITLYTGDCGRTRDLDSGIHFLLNLLSSLFLGACNYCMQISASPSRTEVDKAHSKGISLEIGVHSLRNLRYLQNYRPFIWFALGIVSTILHLVWNSVLYQSIPFVIFTAAIATSDFLNATDSWVTAPRAVPSYNFTNKDLIPDLKDRARTFTRLDKPTCIRSYIDPLTATSDLVIVASNITSYQNNGSSIVQGFVDGLYNTQWNVATSWICFAYYSAEDENRFCNLQWAGEFESSWTLQTWQAPYQQSVQVDYCLVGAKGDNQARCGLQISIPLLSIVCASTLVGTILILATERIVKEPTLLKLGDAIASFLEFPEEISNDVSQLEDRGMLRIKYIPWRPVQRASWFSALTRRTCVLLSVVLSAAILVPACLLADALISYVNLGEPIGIADLWKQGLGQPSGDSLLSGWWGTNHWATTVFPSQLLLVNSLQLLVSFAYFYLNNTITRQLVTLEWVQLLEKNPLLVSWPEGMQRSSTLLSMPLPYSIVFLTISPILHWLVSQSVFVIQTEGYESGKETIRMPLKDSTRAGFSVLGIILVTVTATTLVVVFLIHTRMRKYSNVPLSFLRMGTSSAAISAVCHPPRQNTNAHLLPVRLGVVNEPSSTYEGCHSRITITSSLDAQEPHEGLLCFQPVLD
ncbi:hypothetical protein F5Y16DRAFT_374870 [Xylariaceae sp. FL0255]|nr:hypothetical protein F5Y16DRAFT_374870 [Xylariaceae sp. FL0255]